MTKLTKAIDIAVKGGFPTSGSKIDGHSFFIRSVKNDNRTKGDETSYFRHEHIGKDDRVFYAIKLGNKKGEYTAKITRIQFRGPLVKNGFKDIENGGIDVTTAAKALGAAWTQNWPLLAKLVSELNAQLILDGNWLPAAAKVVDMIGARMAEDIA
ncbi:hypothetical protein KUV47_02020 [Vannielia litorea]|uniref:hypothetical protein n=1 Tax=Vannielia litorea TaxID=1217970 RepID=UPI001C94C875|nr:hypothetical protein [Vannielia litorea]MBY6151975.1 hypothetical protein [Vannielia litorea]